MLIYLLFLSFIWRISTILQPVSLYKTLMQIIFLASFYWYNIIIMVTMHASHLTPVSKFAQNLDTMLIYDLFPSFCTVTMHTSHLYILQFVSYFDAMLINFYDFSPFLSNTVTMHACFSSILQPVSLLKTLMQCWFMTCFQSCFSYTVTMHASHLYSSM